MHVSTRYSLIGSVCLLTRPRLQAACLACILRIQLTLLVAVPI